MRIVWLSHYPINKISGIDIKYNKKKIFHPSPWIVNLSNALSIQKEIDLHIVSMTSWIKKDYHFKRNNINFHILRNPYSIPLSMRGYPGWLPLDYATNFRFSRNMISNILNDLNPDLIHIHGTENQFAFSAMSLERPFVISLQGIVYYLRNYLKSWNKYSLNKQTKQEEIVIRNAKYFFSRTTISDEYIKSLNTNASIFHINEIVSSIFLNEYKTKRDEYLFFAGLVSISKGIEDLLSAFLIVKKVYPNLKLIIAGGYEKNYLNYLKEKYSILFNNNDVVFKGYLEENELYNLYKSAKIFVFPSHFETTPNVLMEAMAMGLPIISTNTGGIPDMITNEITGLLTAIKSPEALSKAIIKILNDPDLGEKLGKNARSEALRRFTETENVTKTIDSYKFIISN